MAGRILSWFRGGGHGKPEAKTNGGRPDLKGKPTIRYDFEADLARIREEMKKPDYGKKDGSVTKAAVLEYFRGLAKDFDLVEAKLGIPERLYPRNPEGTVFSLRQDDDSMYLSSTMRRSGARLPDASEMIFTIGIFDTSFQTYFFLCDPARKIIIMDQLLCQGDGSWRNVAQSLDSALEAKLVADQGREKYNVIVGTDGSARIE